MDSQESQENSSRKSGEKEEARGSLIVGDSLTKEDVGFNPPTFDGDSVSPLDITLPKPLT
jgi:hypothetical protein